MGIMRTDDSGNGIGMYDIISRFVSCWFRDVVTFVWWIWRVVEREGWVDGGEC